MLEYQPTMSLTEHSLIRFKSYKSWRCTFLPILTIHQGLELITICCVVVLFLTKEMSPLDFKTL